MMRLPTEINGRAALGQKQIRLGWRAIAELDGMRVHCRWKSSFKKALTSSWDLFAAASW